MSYKECEKNATTHQLTTATAMAYENEHTHKFFEKYLLIPLSHRAVHKSSAFQVNYSKNLVYSNSKGEQEREKRKTSTGGKGKKIKRKRWKRPNERTKERIENV